MRVESRPIFKKQRRQYRIKEFQSCGDDAWCDYNPLRKQEIEIRDILFYTRLSLNVCID